MNDPGEQRTAVRIEVIPPPGGTSGAAPRPVPGAGPRGGGLPAALRRAGGIAMFSAAAAGALAVGVVLMAALAGVVALGVAWALLMKALGRSPVPAAGGTVPGGVFVYKVFGSGPAEGASGEVRIIDIEPDRSGEAPRNGD